MCTSVDIFGSTISTYRWDCLGQTYAQVPAEAQYCGTALYKLLRIQSAASKTAERLVARVVRPVQPETAAGFRGSFILLGLGFAAETGQCLHYRAKGTPMIGVLQTANPVRCQDCVCISNPTHGDRGNLLELPILLSLLTAQGIVYNAEDRVGTCIDLARYAY